MGWEGSRNYARCRFMLHKVNIPISNVQVVVIKDKIPIVPESNSNSKALALHRTGAALQSVLRNNCSGKF